MERDGGIPLCLIEARHSLGPEKPDIRVDLLIWALTHEALQAFAVGLYNPSCSL